MGTIYAGDAGTEIILECGVDISTASSLSMKVRKPDGTVVNWPATLEGTTGLRYVTQAGDTNLPGLYRVQAVVSLPGWSGSGKTAEVTVYKEFS